jgi:hypothetical protein
MAVWLEVLHIAVPGYWLGSELVINSAYRLVTGEQLPFDQRTRLMEHVMDVDQHVRYALVLQAALGTALAALYGLVPGGETLAWGVLAAEALWLAFVEAVYRLRHAPAGPPRSAPSTGACATGCWRCSRPSPPAGSARRG